MYHNEKAMQTNNYIVIVCRSSKVLLSKWNKISLGGEGDLIWVLEKENTLLFNPIVKR